MNNQTINQSDYVRVKAQAATDWEDVRVYHSIHEPKEVYTNVDPVTTHRVLTRGETDLSGPTEAFLHCEKWRPRIGEAVLVLQSSGDLSLNYVIDQYDSNRYLVERFNGKRNIVAGKRLIPINLPPRKP